MVFVRILFIALVCVSPALHASDATESIRSAIDELKKKMEKEPTQTVVESTIFRDGAIAPLREDQPVKSTFGKVTIGGLTQIWYESIQNNRTGIFSGAPTFTSTQMPPQFLPEDNVGNSIDTFRIRRTELRFRIELTEKVGAIVMMDPARESNSLFSSIPTFLRHNIKTTISNDFKNGTVSSFHPSLLQDAYIVVHDFDKGWFDTAGKEKTHHTFAIGQFKPPAGEEASRDSGGLDFVERAMVAGVNNVRDVGAALYGNWLDQRFNYQMGFFNSPSGTVLTDPEVVEAGNRPDDNNAKDFAWRVQGKPWNVIDPKTKAWFGLEMGYFRTDGVHGGTGQEFDPNFSVTNDLNRRATRISRQGTWAYLKPNGPVRGWWFRGEWGRLHDLFGGDAKTTALGLGSVDLGNTNVRGSSFFSQANPNPVSVNGWFASTGYKIGDSRFAEGLDKHGGRIGKELNNMEFCFRAEAYENIATEDLANPDRNTNLFYTRAYTSGLNYQLNSTTRMQTNYVIVDDPVSRSHGLKEIKNNVFVINIQLKF